MNAVPWIAFACLLAADPAGPALRGTVKDAAGNPVAGARVDVATAAPRVGPALFCPSCYRDCAKSTRTDDRGHFEIAGLDAALKFTLLISAPDKRAFLTKLLDPLQGEVAVALEALPAEAPPGRTVLGQLVDDRGQPVVGALVSPVGGQTADRRWGGTVRGVDPTVSDAAGHFALALPEGYLGVDVQVAARGTAGTMVLLLKPGPDRHRVAVPAGTRVTGRLVRDSRPVSGLRVAVVQIERSGHHHFIKAVGGVTDAEGRFDFDHLPANEGYAIFTPVGDGPQPWVLTTKRFKVHADRQTRDLGDLSVVAGLRLAGRVEVPAGESLPADTRITLGRDPAWDLIAVPVAKDGTFAAEGLPPETYEVRVAAKGFVIDGARLPFQVLRGQSFGVRLRESIADLHIPLVRDGRGDDEP
jgi:hypothetical protein